VQSIVIMYNKICPDLSYPIAFQIYHTLTAFVNFSCFALSGAFFKILAMFSCGDTQGYLTMPHSCRFGLLW
jgi:hypothetical protein